MKALSGRSEAIDARIDEKTLVARAAGGDRSAQQELLEAHYELVHRVLYRVVGPSQDLEDLRQSALLEILHSLPRYRGDSSLSSWVAGVCVNVARHYFRGKKVRSVVVPTADLEQEARAAGPAPDVAAQSNRDLSRALGVLARLSDKHRIAFVLRTVFGYSVDEIAHMTGSAKSTARLRLYYARKAFAKAIGGLAPDQGAER